MPRDRESSTAGGGIRGGPGEDRLPEGGARILLVDDDADSALVLRRVLERSGDDVTVAASVREAIEVGQAGFDILLCDLGLPDGSGISVLEGLGDARPRCAIALTGYGAEEDLRRTREAGFQAHFTKPVDIQRLRRAIAEVKAEIDGGRR